MTHSGVSEFSSLLTTRRFGRALRIHDTVASTNTVASDWAEEGAPDGAVVYADYQTGGRGRLGRSWQAKAGLNLTFSVVLRPELSPERPGMIPIAAGLAAAEAVEKFIEPLSVSIKWPNDLLIHSRKCGGILMESRWSAGVAIEALVLGIGINVNQDEFPPELEDRATSLLLETGRPTAREELFAALLGSLELRIDELGGEHESVRRDYLRRMVQVGAHVDLRSAAGGTVSGQIVGLDESGGIVMEVDGVRRVYHSGEVTFSG